MIAFSVVLVQINSDFLKIKGKDKNIFITKPHEMNTQKTMLVGKSKFWFYSKLLVLFSNF